MGRPQAPDSALPVVLLAVVVVGVLDGICQGAIFGDAASQPTEYTHVSAGPPADPRGLAAHAACTPHRPRAPGLPARPADAPPALPRCAGRRGRHRQLGPAHLPAAHRHQGGRQQRAGQPAPQHRALLWLQRRHHPGRPAGLLARHAAHPGPQRAPPQAARAGRRGAQLRRGAGGGRLVLPVDAGRAGGRGRAAGRAGAGAAGAGAAGAGAAGGQEGLSGGRAAGGGGAGAAAAAAGRVAGGRAAAEQRQRCGQRGVQQQGAGASLAQGAAAAGARGGVLCALARAARARARQPGLARTAAAAPGRALR
jgi:hypothetical protein